MTPEAILDAYVNAWLQAYFNAPTAMANLFKMWGIK